MDKEDWKDYECNYMSSNWFIVIKDCWVKIFDDIVLYKVNLKVWFYWNLKS